MLRAGADLETIVSTISEPLTANYPKWWLSDDVTTIKEASKTALRKFVKKDTREEYIDPSLIEGAGSGRRRAGWGVTTAAAAVFAT